MAPARALILCGGWEGHEPVATAARFGALLENEGLAVEVARDLAVLAEPGVLADCALVVPVWTGGRLDDAGEAALEAAVRAGTGLAGWHGGMADAFRDRPGYHFLVGGQFVAHPGGIRPYTVHIRDREHPISAGLQDFAMESEQYYLHVDPANRVLAETVFDAAPCPWLAGVRMPVAWVRRHGAGRVFYCSLGHTDADFAVPPARELVRRGLLWAARRL